MINEKISDLSALISLVPMSAMVEIDTGTATYSLTIGELLASLGQLTLENVDVQGLTPGMVVTIPAVGECQIAIPSGTFLQAFAQGIALGVQAVDAVGGIATVGYVAGFLGLTPGPIWLGPLGSIICSVNPPNVHGQYNVPLGRAISATEIIFQPGFPTLYR